MLRPLPVHQVRQLYSVIRALIFNRPPPPSTKRKRIYDCFLLFFFFFPRLNEILRGEKKENIIQLSAKSLIAAERERERKRSL